jgi:hypothetical protein
LLSAGVLSNGQIRTPGPFRRAASSLAEGEVPQRTVAASRGTPSARIAGCTRFYVPRSQPDRITVNARCIDGIDGPSLKPSRFFEGRHWEEAQRKRIAEGGLAAPAGLNGAATLQRILDHASE